MKTNFKSLIVSVVTVALAASGAFWLYKNKNISIKSEAPRELDYSLYLVPVSENLPTKAPNLPDISGFTVANIEKSAPAIKLGEVLIHSAKGIPEMGEFTKRDGRIQHLRLSQMDAMPKIINIKSGVYDWPSLYRSVQAQDPQAITKNGDIYTLRLPLLISPGAALVMRGKDVPTLHMSAERGSFIANGGNLNIVGVHIVGWLEKENKQDFYKDKNTFRPFIVSWSGGRMDIGDSRIESLGYLKGKSYGLSYSTCVDCVEENPKLHPPTGTLVGNTFSDLYYGYYCYEAEDVAIIGNTYADNIIYGIDPHDRSRRLIIAKNEVYGSKKKHGIIVSREVNDSWIFDNHTHNNHGSGIMIDRTSVNNVIARNLSENNEQDGLTFFESQNNQTWENIIRNNGRSGVKIRNSWDIRLFNDQILNNKGVAIEIYAISIDDQKTRDFALDPYVQKASAAEISGVIIKSKYSSVFKIGKIDTMELSRIFISPSTAPLFLGNDLSNNMKLVTELQAGKYALEVTPHHTSSKQGSFVGHISTYE